MDSSGVERPQPLEVPDDAVVVRQSQWAWLLYVVPWAVLAVVSLYVDQITFIGLPAVLAIVVILPRYISYRTTVYILAGEHLVIQRGRQRFDVPLPEVVGIRINPGVFGRSLGYAGVNLGLRDGGGAILHYVPQASPLVDHVRQHMDKSAADQGPTEE